MKKILIFGDSHAARLLNASIEIVNEDIADNEFVFDYVCGVGPVAKAIRVIDGVLSLLPKPDRWNHYRLEEDKINNLYDLAQEQIVKLSGENELNLSNYDLVIAIGGRLLTEWKCLVSGSYSAACLAQTSEDMLLCSRHFQWLEGNLSPPSGMPQIVSMAEPPSNESSPEYGSSDIIQKLDFKSAFKLLQAAGRKYGLEIVPLPDELFNNNKNAIDKRFKRAKATDFNHLNNPGSEILFSYITSLLSDISQQSVVTEAPIVTEEAILKHKTT